MTPQFAKAVDPVFERVLQVLEQIGRNENPPPEEVRVRLKNLLDQAAGVAGQTEDWELARYALVYWIDEVLIEAPWDGQRYWVQNPLEVELWGTQLANEQFYHKARDAGALPKRDALEVFYVCVVLNFRGLYRDPRQAEAMGFPPTLEAWAKQTALAIRKGPRPPMDAAGQPGPGAAPLEGQSLLLTACLTATFVGALLAAAATCWIILQA